MDQAAIRHALRGKLNSMQLSVALLPVVEPDEVLVYLEHISKQCERIVELVDELELRLELEQTDSQQHPDVPGTLLGSYDDPFAPPPPTA